jgi:hypothetical protein
MLQVADCSAPQTCNGTDCGAQTDDHRLQELLKMWQTKRQRGLEIRHQTGLLLNDQFGPPAKRQAHGGAVLKHYSACLGIAESELSRMRWFAQQFKSLEDLKAEHPDVSMRTQVKELLVSLRKRKGTDSGTKKVVARKGITPRRPRSVRKALRAIQTTSRLVEGIVMTPKDSNWKIVNGAVAELLKAVEHLLGVRYVPEPIATDEDSALSPTDPVRDIEHDVPADSELICA